MPKIRLSIKLAIIYFVAGVLWISVSDALLNANVIDKYLIMKLQTYKGWFFVVISSLLIFTLSSYYERTLHNKIGALKRANSDLKLFFYKASHDLRGPIKSILGLTRIIDLYQADNDLPLAISHIEISAKKADHLIYDLDRLTHIVDGPLQVAPINFDALIQKMIHQQKKQSPELVEKIDFIKDISENVRNYQSHPYLLELIFEKIIENAVTFTAPYKEKPQINVAVKDTREGLILKIKDNGIGIEDFQTQKIFNMFYKGTEASKGSGLGLYIAQQAVERLHGKIEVRSIHRKESTFIVFLPKQSRHQAFA